MRICERMKEIHGWSRASLGEAFDINPPRYIRRGMLTPFVPMDAIPVNSRRPERTDRREYTGSGTRFRNGDTLVARITPCLENGKTAYISDLPDRVVAHGSTEYIVISGRQGVSDGLFGYYVARSPNFRDYAISRMEGTSGRQRVPADAIEAYQLNLPPLTEQHAIAQILGTLDDKIELNRKQNETLEAMARAIFKAWFVDFEPVRAKMEGRWKRGQSLPGMPAHLYDLFPDRMVESELGAIPEGWGVSALRDVCSYISRGISPKYIDFGGVAVVNQKCIRDFSIDFSKTRRHDASKRKIDDRLLKLWDVLVNSTGVGTLGRVAQVRRLPEATIVDSHVTVLRAGVEINPLYLGLVVGGMQQEIEALAEGSTGQTELSRAKLGELKILLPKNEVLDSFHDFTKSIFDGASSNQIDSDVLARIRDTLLSELVSGRLRVPVSLLNLRGAL